MNTTRYTVAVVIETSGEVVIREVAGEFEHLAAAYAFAKDLAASPLQPAISNGETANAVNCEQTA